MGGSAGHGWGDQTPEREGGPCRVGVAAPLSARPAGLGSLVGVGEEGKGGGLSTLKQYPQPGLPPPLCRMLLDTLICSVTVSGEGGGGEGSGGAGGSLFLSWNPEGRKERGDFYHSTNYPPEHSLIRKIVTQRHTGHDVTHTYTHNNPSGPDTLVRHHSHSSIQ